MKNLLIHIGFQRTLTTWLQKNLFNNKNSGYFLLGSRNQNDHKSRISEYLNSCHPGNYPKAEILRAIQQDYEYAIENNFKPVISNERLCGNPFSGAYDCYSIANLLKDLFPEAKIIIGIREQNSMIFSHWLRYIASGGTLDLEQYLESNNSRYKKLHPLFNLDTFNYHLLSSHYEQFYGKENVLILPIEQFSKSSEEYLDVLFKFSGLETIKSLDTAKRENNNHDLIAIEIQRIFNKLSGFPIYGRNPLKNRFFKLTVNQSRIIAKLFPEFVKNKRKLNKRSFIIEKVNDYYVQSNRLLQENVIFNLGNLGYKL